VAREENAPECSFGYRNIGTKIQGGLGNEGRWLKIRREGSWPSGGMGEGGGGGGEIAGVLASSDNEWKGARGGAR
jgi:hypothetical protein